jgi:hypothetical protein
VKSKTWLGCLVLALVAAAVWWLLREGAPASEVVVAPPASGPGAAPASVRPAPNRARDMVADTDSGMIDGRVLDAVTREGVPNAELTFLGDGGALTFRTSSDGTFVITPAVTGDFVLSTITATGFLPYALAAGHAGVRLTIGRGPPVHGVTLLLHPAIDYEGLVVDPRGAPVWGARVRVLGGPAGEQALESSVSEWSTDRDGRFTFQAAERTVLEASRGNLRGWAHVDRAMRTRKKLRIQLGHAPPRDATITGRVRDTTGAPIADAVVRAAPSFGYGDVATVVATTEPDGTFTVSGTDRGSYDLTAEVDGYVPGERDNVMGGSRNVELTLDAGLPLAGAVVDTGGAPVAVFTLIVRRRAGLARKVVATRSIIDPHGRFAVRVPAGDYDLIVSSRGKAAAPTEAAAGTTDLRIVLGAGATLRGTVIASDDRMPIGNAWVGRHLGGELGGRGPAGDPAALTRLDGSFELTGIAPGPLAIIVRADGYHRKIEMPMTASEGAVLGPLTIELTRVEPDDFSRIELVGIGIGLSPEGDALLVTQVVPGSGAFDAGIGYGDRVIAVDGLPVAPLGLEGVLARIRGTAGTTVRLTLRRDGRDIVLPVERRLLRT